MMRLQEDGKQASEYRRRALRKYRKMEKQAKDTRKVDFKNIREKSHNERV